MDKYEEALERAKQGMPMDEVFPELKESEEEMVRMDLVNVITWLRNNPHLSPHYYNDRYDRILSYLERQKERKPAEWSEVDEGYLMDVKSAVNYYFDEGYAEELCTWFKPLRPQPKNELSDEDKENLIIAYLVSLGYPIDANGNIPNYNQTFESCKSALVYWLQQNLQKMLANKRIEPDGIKTETLLKDSYIQAYREGIEDSIRELSSQCENSSPQPHWKPSEYTLSLVKKVANGEMLTHMEQMAMETLCNDLQKLM